ncbi:hypothetical protein [Rhizobium halophilum]|uniref:hypothetical protein n=1 Tax=Rhizobium halophilum TaxID=2846852 RepID=UPI001EFE3FC4|nr:hypothetical protein [Rhizobium halophilum]MCF6367242.1 hypothetical protein [Rhizobium halophilum]
MSNTTDFIAELVRAANEVERLTEIERGRLFERSVTTIRAMRETVSIQSAQADADKIVELQVMVAIRGTRTKDPSEVRDALLTAAGMIRDLHIVLDTGTEIELGGGKPV